MLCVCFEQEETLRDIDMTADGFAEDGMYQRDGASKFAVTRLWCEPHMAPLQSSCNVVS